jgi:hypothetical protein
VRGRNLTEDSVLFELSQISESLTKEINGTGHLALWKFFCVQSLAFRSRFL